MLLENFLCTHVRYINVEQEAKMAIKNFHIFILNSILNLGFPFNIRLPARPRPNDSGKMVREIKRILDKRRFLELECPVC